MTTIVDPKQGPLTTLSGTACAALSRLKLAFAEITKLGPYSTEAVIYGTPATNGAPGMRGARAALDDLVGQAFALLDALPCPGVAQAQPDTLDPSERWLLRQAVINATGDAERLKLHHTGELAIARKLLHRGLGHWSTEGVDPLGFFVLNGAGLEARERVVRERRASIVRAVA